MDIRWEKDTIDSSKWPRMYTRFHSPSFFKTVSAFRNYIMSFWIQKIGKKWFRPFFFVSFFLKMCVDFKLFIDPIEWVSLKAVMWTVRTLLFLLRAIRVLQLFCVFKIILYNAVSLSLRKSVIEIIYMIKLLYMTTHNPYKI